jgi:O-antigen biosynthesis protein
VVAAPVSVVELGLDNTLTPLEDLAGYLSVQALVRLHGAPVGYVRVPVVNGRISANSLGAAIVDELADAALRHLLSDLLSSRSSTTWRLEDLLRAPHPARIEPLLTLTVAVCTRDRPQDLRLCLDALERLDYPYLDLLVVDNAPTNDATERVVTERGGRVRYVREPRPGLDWARNRAILEARGEILAYTDDDAIVDQHWATAIASAVRVATKPVPQLPICQRSRS